MVGKNETKSAGHLARDSSVSGDRQLGPLV